MISRSAIPRRVTIGKTVFENVPPPTIQDAFETFDILRHAEDESDLEILRFVLRRWLPLKLADTVIELDPLERSRVLRRLILDGTPEPSEPKDSDKSKTPSRKDKNVNLESVFARYLETFSGVDPWIAYTTHPFPFFLNVVSLSPAVLAIRTQTLIDATSYPHLKPVDQKKTNKRLQKATGYDADQARADEYTEKLTPEELAAERSELEKTFSTVHRKGSS